MKNTSLISLIFWIFSISSIIAQTPQWAHVTKLQSTQSVHDANQIKIDPDGSIYVAGNYLYLLSFSDSDIELNGIGANNTYLYKRSAMGELLWARTIGVNIINDLFDMAIDHDGNIYLVGQYRGQMAVGSGGNSISLSSIGLNDGYIVKYSPTGALLAAHSLGGSSKDNLTAISFDNDNNIILAGNFYGEVDFDLSQSSQIEDCAGLTFVKYTENFELISVHKLNSVYTFITNIEVNAANQVIFGGYFREYITLDSGEGITIPDAPQFTDLSFIMKLSNTFEFEWVAAITGTSKQYIFDMQLTPSGAVYVAGDISNTATFLSNDQTQILENSSGSRDIFFAKVSPFGNFEWVKTMGGAGNDFAFGLELDNDGNIFLTGSFSQTVDFDPGSGSAEYTSEAISSTYLSIYNSEGEYFNTITYDNPFEGNPLYAGGNAASGIALNADNDIYLTGWFKTGINFDPSQPGFEFTSAGQDCYILKLGSVIVGLPETRGGYPISIFPNPARDEVHIEAPNIQKIEVYNIHGKLVWSDVAQDFGDRHVIGVSHLPTGTYILNLTANDGFVGSEKLVIIR